MPVATILVERYKCTDGTIFESKKEAEIHQRRIENIVYYRVNYSPDLTEGRGLQKSGIIALNVTGEHSRFVTYACEKVFGPEYAFVQGYFGINAMTKNWSTKRLDVGNEFDPSEVIITVEEARAETNVFPKGITYLPLSKHWSC